MDYSFINIPTGIWAKRFEHSFIYGGCRYPVICGSTETSIVSQQNLESGYVWAPYVPMQVSSTFLDPNDFRFRKGIRTRYAKLMCRSEFYGVLTLSNLSTASAGAFGPATTEY